MLPNHPRSPGRPLYPTKSEARYRRWIDAWYSLADQAKRMLLCFCLCLSKTDCLPLFWAFKKLLLENENIFIKHPNHFWRNNLRQISPKYKSVFAPWKIYLRPPVSLDNLSIFHVKFDLVQLIYFCPSGTRALLPGSIVEVFQVSPVLQVLLNKHYF